LSSRGRRDVIIPQLHSTPTPQQQSSSSSSWFDSNKDGKMGFWERIVVLFSQTQNTKRTNPTDVTDRQRQNLLTLFRVGIPSVVAGAVASLIFPTLALTLAGMFTNAGALAVLSQDSSQFVQNFLTVAGLLFSILVGQTCE
jgi:hypothetical protein